MGKLKILNGAVNDLLDFRSYMNPIYDSFFSDATKAKFNLKVDLLTGEIESRNYDRLTEIYLEKAKWFRGFCLEKGILDEINSAVIEVRHGVESVRIECVNGRVFEK